MSNILTMLSELMAEEAIEWVLNTSEARQKLLGAEERLGEDEFATQGKLEGFVAIAALIEVFSLLPITDESRETLPRDLTRALRPFVIRKAKSDQMPAMAKATAGVLIKAVPPENLDPRLLTVASMRIATGVLYLLHLHARAEQYLLAADDVLPEVAPILRRLVCAMEPTASPEIAAKRLARADMPAYLASACHASGFRALWFSHAFRVPSQELCAAMANDLDTESLENPSAIDKYVRALLEGPSTWSLTLYMKLREEGRRAVSDAAQCDAEDFVDWLERESCNLRDLQSWLAHEAPHGGGNAFSALMHALWQREAGNDSWFSTWKRCVDFDAPAKAASFWNHDGCSSAEFETFWRAQGFLEANLDEMAEDTLERALASGMNAGQIWLLLAFACTRQGKYGKAEHAIQQAEQNPPRIFVTVWTQDARWIDAPAERWNEQVLAVHEMLGSAALHKAKASHVVEPSLLEIAIRYGNAQDASEAALCAMDAQCDGLEELLTLCFHCDSAASQFVEKIVVRREVADLDDMYEVSQIFARECPGDVRADILEAMSRIDAPEMAAQSLDRAIRRLDCETSLFWECADLWIELQCSIGAFDEAVYGIVHAFGASHPRAPRSLLFLMASIPQDARQMLQGALVEALGQEGAIQLLARTKAEPQSEPVKKTPQFDPLEIALWMMPAPWQMMYHGSRQSLPPTPEEIAKAKRRDSVLRARGGLPSAEIERPSDAPAWEHKEQPFASSGFRSKMR